MPTLLTLGGQQGNGWAPCLGRGRGGEGVVEVLGSYPKTVGQLGTHLKGLFSPSQEISNILTTLVMSLQSFFSF